jgi:hypothetical protein
MTPEQFTYWLQGFVETNNKGHHPTPKQWELIKRHLATVFKKETSNIKETA